MALSKTHILASLLAIERLGLSKKFPAKTMIPFVVLPDALRCFNYYGRRVIFENNRVITHFEINPNTGKASFMEYPQPVDLQVFTDELASNLKMHIEEGYNQVALGDETSIEEFVKHNKHVLPYRE